MFRPVSAKWGAIKFLVLGIFRGTIILTVLATLTVYGCMDTIQMPVLFGINPSIRLPFPEYRDGARRMRFQIPSVSGMEILLLMPELITSELWAHLNIHASYS